MIVTNREMKRKRIRKKGMMLNALFMLSLLCGCTQSEVMKGGKEGKTEEVSSCFHLNVLATTVASTRSMVFTPCGTAESDSLTGPVGGSVTRSVNDPGEASDKTILDLWVGQYGSNGDLVMEEYFSSMASQESVNLPLKRIAGTSHVWVVANAGNLSGKAETESVLKTLSVDNAFSDDGLPANNLCVMTGMWSGETTENIVADIQLKRSLAKIKFIYSVGGEKFSFTPYSLELCNVPIRMKYIGDENPVQLTGDEKFKTYTVISPGNSGTHCWYVPENPAGTGTNTGGDAVNKTGEGVTHATCVRLTGEAVQDGVTYGNVVFTLYPGKDNNDYSIVRNGLYTINVTLTGIDFSDKRVTVGTIPEMQDPDNLGAEKGATGMFQVTTRPGMPWSFTIPGWLSALIGENTYDAGTQLNFVGPYKIELKTTTANPRAEIRETSFTVGEKIINVRQEPSALVVGSSISLAAEEGAVGNSTFMATKGLPWSAVLTSEGNDWFKLSGETPTLGIEATGTNETLTVQAVTSNPSSVTRSGTLLLKGGDAISNPSYTGLLRSISVTQAGSTISGSLQKPGPEAKTDLFGSFTATKGLSWSAEVTTGNSWLSLLTPTNGITNGEEQSINYQTTINLSFSERTGIIMVHAGNDSGDLYPGPSADIKVIQSGSVFEVTGPSSDISEEGGSVTGEIKVTTGLPWSITPETDNGITVSPTNGNENAVLTFSALKNVKNKRTGTFTVSIEGASPSRTATISVFQKVGVAIVSINQEIATAYKGLEAIAIYPPFNKEGVDYKGTSSDYTITTPYTIEVEAIQSSSSLNYSPASNYCSSKGTGWRLPTMIELFAIWQICKGTNDDGTDDEFASEAFGEKFISDTWYWSCGVYPKDKSRRCLFNFGGTYYHGDRNYPWKVRCVRDYP